MNTFVLIWPSSVCHFTPHPYRRKDIERSLHIERGILVFVMYSGLALIRPIFKDAQLRIQASKMAMKVPYLLFQNPKYEAYRGALTKCQINDQRWILEHLKVDAVLTPNVLAARHIIAKKGGAVVLMIRKEISFRQVTKNNFGYTNAPCASD